MAAYELAHTYAESEIFDVQYAQINDIINLAHGNHKPARLTRLAANSWTLADSPIVGGPFYLDNYLVSSGTTYILTSATVTVPAFTGTVTMSSSANIFIASGSTLNHQGTYFKIGNLVTNATTGLQEQGYVIINEVINPSTASVTIKNSAISTTAATTTWAHGAWSSIHGYPSRVTFHQSRLFYARTNYQPQQVWGSKSFSYDNFAVDGGADDDAIDIQLASNESNDIKWIVPASKLIAGTYGGEYVIGTGDGSPLTPATTNVSKETSWGSEAVVPKKIGNFYYYVQRFSQKIREFFFSFDNDSYKSADRTILAPHICEDGIVDMAYQQNPDTVLWCVTTNGTIATMTREVDQEVTGWAKQTTDGTYESIASIPSASEPHDEVWVVVARTISGITRRFIERFYSPIVPDSKDQCVYVHSNLTYDGYAVSAASTATTISLSATGGTSVLVTASATYFTSGDVGQRIRAIDADRNTVGELKITGYTSGTIVVGTVTKVFDASSYVGGLWGLSVTIISGYDHLEAEDVRILADGGTDYPDKTVSSGTITLTRDAFVVNAGLPYTQRIVTLPPEAGAQRGTAQGKLQDISELAFKVNRSHAGFYYGTNDSNLKRARYRSPETEMGTPEPLFTGVIPNLSVFANPTHGVQVILQNTDPLPVELLSITEVLDTQEKA